MDEKPSEIFDRPCLSGDDRKRGRGLIDRIEQRFFHIDVHANADDHTYVFIEGNSFGQDAGDFFSLEEKIVGPLDLGKKSLMLEQRRARESQDLPYMGEERGEFRERKKESDKDIFTLRGDPDSVKSPAPRRLDIRRNAGDFVRIERVGVEFCPCVCRPYGLEMEEINSCMTHHFTA